MFASVGSGTFPASAPQRNFLQRWALPLDPRSRTSSSSSSCSSASDSLSPEDVDSLRSGGREAVLKAIRNPPVPDEGDAQADLVLLDASREVIEDPEISPGMVVLHIYDLHTGLQGANEVLAFSSESVAVGGAFHAGVEVSGSEWSYGRCGVCSILPRSATQHRYRCSILLGETGLGSADLATVISEMCQEWRGADYQIIGRNCCRFAAELSDRLGVGPMPPWVDRFARLLQAGHEVGRGAVEAGWETSEVVRREVAAASRAAGEIAVEASKVIHREAVTHSQEASRFLRQQVRGFAKQAQPQLQAMANSALEASAETAGRAKAALSDFLDQAIMAGGQELETSTGGAMSALGGFFHQIVGDVHKQVGIGYAALAPGVSRPRLPLHDGPTRPAARVLDTPNTHWQHAPPAEAQCPPIAQPGGHEHGYGFQSGPHEHPRQYLPNVQPACQHRRSRAGSLSSGAGPHPQNQPLVQPAMVPAVRPYQSYAAPVPPCQSFAVPPTAQGPHPGIGQALRCSAPTPLRRVSVAV